MPGFKIVNNANEINLNEKWTPATKFKSKGKIVDVKGHEYRIIEKRERTFSGLERFGRGLLGTIAVISTLCLALFSKSIKKLFTKSNESVRFAVLESKSKVPVPLPNDKNQIASPNDNNQKSLPNPYAALTQAKEEILTWFGKEGSTLGKGEYNTLMAKLDTLSKDLPKKKITLHCDYFKWGFDLFYVEKPEQEKYMPITRPEGIILEWQAQHTPSVILPLKDPEDNSYFIPEITVNKVYRSHSGSEPTGDYIGRLIRSALYETKSYRILEGLTGYAEIIQKAIGNSSYKQLKEMITAYPDLPDLPEKSPYL